MKYQRTFKTRLSHRSVLSLAAFVVFSIACQGSSSSSSIPQSGNTERSRAASSSQVAVANPATAESPDVKSVAKPRIQITEVPRKGPGGPDEMETIAGKVDGVNAEDCKVVLFAGTNTWYVQPYMDSYDTPIKEGGTWRNDTHLGAQYAALLVKKSYKPPMTTGKLPSVGGEVLAIVTMDGKQ